MSVAVLGAGLQGVCAALALAERGCRVDVYDRQPFPMEAASRWNEGKLHLGYLFLRDRSLRSAKTMLEGSLRFADLIERWTGITFNESCLSSPFIYAVHRDSRIPADEIERRLYAIDAERRVAARRLGLSYLGLPLNDAGYIERLAQPEIERHWNSSSVLAAFRTPERSVEPAWLASRLRVSLTDHPNVTFFGGQTIEHVVRTNKGRFEVQTACAGATERLRYDHVVNALWHDRLRIDAGLGYRPQRRWLFRFKLAVHIAGAAAMGDLPSTTLVNGPFGDVVNFGAGRFYLSWYPACRLAESTDVSPPPWTDHITDRQRRLVLHDTLENLERIFPDLAGLDLNGARVDVAGGVIFAWGHTDIDDPKSGLHWRHDIGVASDRCYHSINTGKLGMAPWFALQVADQIQPPNKRSFAATMPIRNT